MRRLLLVLAGVALGTATAWYWTWTRHEDPQEKR